MRGSNLSGARILERTLPVAPAEYKRAAFIFYPQSKYLSPEALMSGAGGRVIPLPRGVMLSPPQFLDSLIGSQLTQVSEPTSFNRKPEEVAVTRATTPLSR